MRLDRIRWCVSGVHGSVLQERLPVDLRQDLAAGIRAVRRSIGFSTLVVVVLGLGIGANTLFFAIADAVVFPPFPFRDPDRLVIAGENIIAPRSEITYRDFRTWREQAQTLAEMSAIASCAKTRPIELRGLAVVELEQPAEALTTRDRAGTDLRCRGRDEFVVQTLVRTFFMIMINKRANGGSQVRLAEEHHSLQALGLGGLDKAFGKRVQIRTPGREDQWLIPLSRSRRRNAMV
jgi:hypothetical protein